MTSFNRSSWGRALLGSAVTFTALLGAERNASACGGFFCNASQPVNQAAERIVFADNGDGTVTAVIQIQYQGPADKFAWLLPIPTAPDPEEFRVASDLAFTRLQALTNPTYSLTTRVEGTCKQVSADSNAGFGLPGSVASPTPTFTTGPSVTVEASGSVGPFDWEVISVEEGTDEPAAVAVQWLGDHDYAVPDSSEGLLGPYLEEGLFLLAVKLTKTASAGSIRPIVITYEAEQAMIPVKLTSVAANDDMGVMTWLLGEGRGVPQNYLSLELNEARLNWFNANSNYNQVVIEAADDAGGQGFVTEYAGDTSGFAGQIWFDYEEQQWTTFNNTVFDGFEGLFNAAYSQFGTYEGFWDAVSESVALPQTVSFEDFKLCPSCYADQITFTPSQLMAALETHVIEPMRIVQELVDAHPELTRLYTTLSAEEMTVDPLFTFNPDLEAVSNVHTAERVIECNGAVEQFQAPWRIELPQGGVVRGTANDVSSGVWPAALTTLPPNRAITRQSSSGAGKVLEDNSEKIQLQLADYNDSVPLAPQVSPTGEPSDPASPAANTGASGGRELNDGKGCGVPTHSRNGAYGLFAVLAVLGVLVRRRRER